MNVLKKINSSNSKKIKTMKEVKYFTINKKHKQ